MTFANAPLALFSKLNLATPEKALPLASLRTTDDFATLLEASRQEDTPATAEPAKRQTNTATFKKGDEKLQLKATTSPPLDSANTPVTVLPQPESETLPLTLKWPSPSQVLSPEQEQTSVIKEETTDSTPKSSTPKNPALLNLATLNTVVRYTRNPSHEQPLKPAPPEDEQPVQAQHEEVFAIGKDNSTLTTVALELTPQTPPRDLPPGVISPAETPPEVPAKIAQATPQPLAKSNSNSEQSKPVRQKEQAAVPGQAVLTNLVLPAVALPNRIPAPHAGMKTKDSKPAQLEAPKLSQAPAPLNADQTPPAEIAFEAKLTPKGTQILDQPPPQLPVVAGAKPEVPQVAVEAIKKTAAPYEKPDAEPEVPLFSGHTIVAHAADASAKQPSTSTVIASPAQTAKAPEHFAPADKPASPKAAELDIPELPAPRTEPARDISFRVGATAADAVDVKLVDRGGQVQVAVRSSDPALTQSLQSNITELAGKLERSGFHTETIIPNRTEPTREPQQNPGFGDPQQQQRRAPQQDLQQPRKRSTPNNSTFTLTPQQENA